MGEQWHDNPRNRGDPTCTEFGNGPFLGDLGAVLGVVLGVVRGSPPPGGEIFLRAIGGRGRAKQLYNSVELRPRWDHGRPEGSKARTKDEEIEGENKPTT
jgi:hypothetical protein